MSTDRKRLNSAIQRIAREDPEIRKLLDDFRNSGGKPSESATSGAGAEDRQICCDGGTSGSTNPGSGTNDPNENPQDGIDPDDPADISDNLSGVTDCDTGQPICFSGSDWIPPDGWESPTNPPFDPSYEEDRYWYINNETGASKCKSATKDGALSCYAGFVGRDVCNDREDSTTISCKDDDGSNLLVLFNKGPFQGGCNVDDQGENYCNPSEDEIKLSEWPEDGCVNLAIKGGKIVGSKFDPENDGSWSAPRDEVELCDAFGNSFKLKASGSIEGGWKSISAQNPDDGYLYNGKGEQIARISESEYSDPTM